MMLCHYITPANIVVPVFGGAKRELLSSLVSRLAEQNHLKNPSRLLQTLLDREEEGSTFLPKGIAIPHARVPDVEEIKVIMGVLPDGFKETPESDPTYLIILFFSPTKDTEFSRHLKLLSRISSVFRDPAFVKEAAQLKNPDDIFALIQHKERGTVEE